VVGFPRRGGIAALVLGACVTAFQGCGLDADGASGLFPDDGGAMSDARIDGVHVDASADATTDAPSEADDANAESDARDAADARDVCAPDENCLDGVDNDCNGLTDCADPACTAGYRCVAAPPPAWSGFALYADRRTAGCPSSFPNATDTFESLTFAPASCVACA